MKWLRVPSINKLLWRSREQHGHTVRRWPSLENESDDHEIQRGQWEGLRSVRVVLARRSLRAWWICRAYELVSMGTAPIGCMWVWAHVCTSALSKPAWWHREQGGGGSSGQFFQLVDSLRSDESFNTKALTSDPFVCSASFKRTFKVLDITILKILHCVRSGWLCCRSLEISGQGATLCKAEKEWAEWDSRSQTGSFTIV